MHRLLTLALIVALCIATAQAILPLAGAARGNLAWMNVARPAAQGQFVFVVIAFACLAYSFVNNDFSVLNVATNSNSSLPWYYRFAATWGSHEGSLLLWVQSGADAQTRPAAALMEAPRALVFDETARATLLVREAGRNRLTLCGEVITRLMDDPRAQSALVDAVELLFPSDS